MNNTLTRTIFWFPGIAILIALILFFPEPKYLAFNLCAVIVSGAAAFEVRKLLSFDDKPYSLEIIYTAYAGLITPGLMLLEIFDLISVKTMISIIIYTIAAIFAAQALRQKKENFPKIQQSIARHLIMLVYPGFFMAFLVRFSLFPNTGILILTFLFSVFFNDTMAFIAGKLFGRRRYLFAVSPNKSLAGFIGGFVLSPAVLIVSRVIFPHVFPGPFYRILILGAIVGIVTITGDLAESAFKRGGKQKDSGQVIPGRGGLLDSIDSPIFCAPFFYYFYSLLFFPAT